MDDDIKDGEIRLLIGDRPIWRMSNEEAISLVANLFSYLGKPWVFLVTKLKRTADHIRKAMNAGPPMQLFYEVYELLEDEAMKRWQRHQQESPIVVVKAINRTDGIGGVTVTLSDNTKRFIPDTAHYSPRIGFPLDPPFK